jgi:hypothetical protein
MKRGWIVKIKTKNKRSNKSKCILLGIKDDNIPPKFVVPIEP